MASVPGICIAVLASPYIECDGQTDQPEWANVAAFELPNYVHTEDMVALLAISQRRDAPYLSAYEIDQLLKEAGFK